MLINFQQPILGMDNVPMKDEKEVVILLENVAVNSLLATRQDDNATGTEKVKRFALAMKINNVTEPVEVTAEEITLIKDLVGKVYTTIVVGRAYDLLEQKVVPA